MRFEKCFFLTALVLYVVSAWFSTGYYSGDELLSIIEFAAYKIGTIEPEQLTWDFDARIRPALQPFIAFLLFKVLGFLRITDPYTQAFILRLLTALLAVFSIRFFTRTCRKRVRPEFHAVYLFLSYFLWFLPCVNVRFMSESWSGIMLLNAMSVLLNPNIRKYKFYLVGGLLGLSFLFRYQNAFLAIGLFLWLIIIRKERILSLTKLLTSGIAVFLLGIFLDIWLYGEFVLTSWNYFYVNLVDGVASSFGTEAWWNYFYSIFRFSFFPIGIPIIISFFLLTIKKPRNIFIWTILPFFVIHSIIPHKELRFLFPVVNLVPIILILAYQEIDQAITSWKRPGQLALRYVLVVLLAINCVGAVTVSLKPSDVGLMTITRYIRQNYGDMSIRLISFNQSNPYGRPEYITTFYMEDDMEDIRLGSLNELADSLLHKNKVNLLVLKREDAETVLTQELLNRYSATKKVQCIPEWMEPLMTLYGGVRRRDIRELYEIPIN